MKTSVQRMQAEQDKIARFAPRTFEAHIDLVDAYNDFIKTSLSPSFIDRVLKRTDKLRNRINLSFVNLVIAMCNDEILPSEPVDFPAVYMRFVRPMFVLRPDRGLANKELWQFCDPFSQSQKYVQSVYRSISMDLGGKRTNSRLAEFRRIPLSS